MATRRYASAAVEALAAYLESALPTKLATVATEEEVTLTAPVAYLRGEHPREARSPIVEVAWDESRPEDLRNAYWFHNLSVNVLLRGADVDAIKIQQNLTRYLTAVIRTIQADPTLGAATDTYEAEITGAEQNGFAEDGRLTGEISISVTLKRTEVA